MTRSGLLSVCCGSRRLAIRPANSDRECRKELQNFNGRNRARSHLLRLHANQSKMQELNSGLEVRANAAWSFTIAGSTNANTSLDSRQGSSEFFSQQTQTCSTTLVDIRNIRPQF
jgi:hypothetical protein